MLIKYSGRLISKEVLLRSVTFCLLFLAIVFPHFALRNFSFLGILLDSFAHGLVVLVCSFVVLYSILNPKFTGMKFTMFDYILFALALWSILDIQGISLVNKSTGVIVSSSLLYYSIAVLFKHLGTSLSSRYLSICILFSLFIQGFFFLGQITGILLNPNRLFDIGGSFGHPGYTLGLLSLGVLIIISFKDYFHVTRGYYYYSFIVLSLMTLVLSLVTVSRVSLILFVFAFLPNLDFFFLNSFIFYRKKRGIIIAAISLVGFIGLGLAKSDSIWGRIFIWKNCINIFIERPITGYGSGSFINIYNNYQIRYFEKSQGSETEKMLADYVILAYNDFIEVSIEMGLIGLLLLVSLYLISFRKILSNPSSKIGKYLLPGFFVFMCFWGVLYDTLYSSLFFICLALFRNCNSNKPMIVKQLK